jgi:hypothetical protein
MRISSNSGLGGIDLAFKSGPQAKIFQMYSLLDEVMPIKAKKHKKSKRVEAAEKLKLMIQELVAENLDLRNLNKSTTSNAFTPPHNFNI